MLLTQRMLKQSKEAKTLEVLNPIVKEHFIKDRNAAEYSSLMWRKNMHTGGREVWKNCDI